MNRKKGILIGASIVGVIVIAGLVVVGLYLINRSVVSSVPTVSADVRKAEDGSNQYGACSIFDVATIKATLGAIADTIQEPQKVGLATFPNGDEVETCSYAFIPGGTIENNYNIQNSLSVEVFAHATQSSLDTYLQEFRSFAEVTEVTGIGDSTLYAKRLFNENDIKYTAVVVKGLRHYTVMINHPAGSEVLDDTVTKDSLLSLLRTVNF